MLTSKENLDLGDDAVRHLHEHVNRCLDELGGNMAELSRQIGMGSTAIRDFLLAVEAGSRYPSIRIFLGVAEVVGYSVSELIGETSARQSRDDELVLQASRKLTPENRRVWIAQSAALITPGGLDDTPDGYVPPRSR